jgi:uncharacterized lipoprotein YajG
MKGKSLFVILAVLLLSGCSLREMSYFRNYNKLASEGYDMHEVYKSGNVHVHSKECYHGSRLY